MWKKSWAAIICLSLRIECVLQSGQSVIKFTRMDDMKVVVKRSNRQRDFIREVETLANLKHCSNILQPIFVIPELREIGFRRIVEGDLYHRQDLPQQSFSQIKDWARQLIESVQCVHDAGFLHLDVKPENVLLEESKIWLIDFGLACPRDDPVRGIGTTRTMAPEMLLEESANIPITVATDWWSVGVTLFFLFSRHLQPSPDCHYLNFPYVIAQNNSRIDWRPMCNNFPSSLLDLLFGDQGFLSDNYHARLLDAQSILSHGFFSKAPANVICDYDDNRRQSH